MPRRALLHSGTGAADADSVAHDDTSDRCRVWRTYQYPSNGGGVPNDQCPCGSYPDGLTAEQTRMCTLHSENQDTNSGGFLSGGEALFFLLILLAVSLCVSVLLSPASRTRRRERREQEAAAAEQRRKRLEQKWHAAVTQGVWGTMPDGSWRACVPEYEDTSMRRRRKKLLVHRYSLDGKEPTETDSECDEWEYEKEVNGEEAVVDVDVESWDGGDRGDSGDVGHIPSGDAGPSNAPRIGNGSW